MNTEINNNFRLIAVIDLNKEVNINLTVGELSILKDGIWQGMRFLEEEIENYHPEPNPRRIYLSNRINELQELYDKLMKMPKN